MKQIALTKVLLAITLVSALFGCGKDDDDDVANNNSNQDVKYEEMLMGTSWKQEKFVSGDHGEKEERHNGIMTFGYDHKYYLIGIDDKYDAEGTWAVKDGIIKTSIKYQNSGMTPASFRVSALLFSGYTLDRIGLLTDTKLRLLWITEDETYKYWRTDYYKVPYQEGTNHDWGSSDDGSGSSSAGEAPYVTSFTFSATKSSITVKFMCNEKPTSATVKYGESSATKSVSSSITGKQVSATASGLKAGTKYYFKCTVKNSYGSSTSDEYSAITNY